MSRRDEVCNKDGKSETWERSDQKDLEHLTQGLGPLHGQGNLEGCVHELLIGLILTLV